MTSTDTQPEIEISGPRAPIRRRIMATSVRAPVVAAVESATARETAEVAAQLASELKAPLTFIHVRPRPPASAGSVRSRRQSVRELFRAHGALGVALSVATRWGVVAQGEIVDGNPVDELVKAATRRKARLLVVGSRRRRFKRSVSRGVLKTSAVPCRRACPPALTSSRRAAPPTLSSPVASPPVLERETGSRRVAWQNGG